jgi:cellulose synthase/poly-beta-1,6-N-acetylglucosamine synthase-like glycosyltransferase
LSQTNNYKGRVITSSFERHVAPWQAHEHDTRPDLNMHTISVVIPSLNAPLIAHTVESILQYSRGEPLEEIIVVGLDNRGLIPVRDRVRFICTERPVNAARARNIGHRAASGEIVCFIDADCIAMEGWPRHFATHFAEGRSVVGGGVELTAGNCWSVSDNVTAFGSSLSCMPPGERPYLPTLNLALRRRLLEEAGGFDEAFSIGEDMDLSYKLRRLGYSLHFEPRASVQHCHDRTSARAVWRHMSSLGEMWMPVRARYEDLVRRPMRTQMAQRAPLGLALFGPIMATVDVARLFCRTVALRPYWRMAPALVWARLAWYVGVARGMAHANRG